MSYCEENVFVCFRYGVCVMLIFKQSQAIVALLVQMLTRRGPVSDII